MKLSSLTNKHPDGQWFTYRGVLKVKLKYGQGITHRLQMATQQFIESASEALESGEGVEDQVKAAEANAGQAIVKVMCEEYFVDFESAEDDPLTDDEGNVLENSLANRMRMLAEVSELFDFVDERISTYDYWT